MLSEAERDDEDEKGRPKCRWRDNNRFWAILLLGPLSFGVVGCEKKKNFIGPLRGNFEFKTKSLYLGSIFSCRQR